MVKQAKNPGVDPRDLWLAGLGVVSLTRKQAARVYGTLVEEGTQFRDATSKRIDALNVQARKNLVEAKARVEAKVDPLVARATGAYGAVKSEVEARLSPVVDAFTKAPLKAGTTRKAAARKAAAAKKTVKKAAGKARSAVKKSA